MNAEINAMQAYFDKERQDLKIMGEKSELLEAQVSDLKAICKSEKRSKNNRFWKKHVDR